MRKVSNSQIESTPEIIKFIFGLKTPTKKVDLILLRDTMFNALIFRDYDNETKEHEKFIRWKRTASQILEDGYVYKGKDCTDLVVLFIALCHTFGLETYFAKLTKEKKVHSVAEIKLLDGWYIFDVSDKNSQPIKGEITEKNPYKDWKLWKKARDAWDLGLVDFNSIRKIDY